MAFRMERMAHGSYSIPFNLKLKWENVKLVLFRRIDWVKKRTRLTRLISTWQKNNDEKEKLIKILLINYFENQDMH